MEYTIDKYIKDEEYDYLHSFDEYFEDEEEVKSVGFDLSFWSELTNKQRTEINEVFEYYNEEIEELKERLDFIQPSKVDLFETISNMVKAGNEHLIKKPLRVEA
jgi:hypothetical protein